MQFQVATWGQEINIAAVEREVQAIDPAAVVDVASDDDQLRIATWLTDVELVAAITRAGHQVLRSQVRRMPSECCGGCGG